MKPSENCYALIKESEILRLKAYLCPAGKWTIGYGHTAGVKEGMTCTEEQADSWLEQDSASSAAAVERLVKVPLNQGQFDALVDFIFNLGSGNFASSTLLKLLNEKNYDGAAKEFNRWVYGNVNGQNVKLDGLITRRKKETNLFQSGG